MSRGGDGGECYAAGAGPRLTSLVGVAMRLRRLWTSVMNNPYPARGDTSRPGVYPDKPARRAATKRQKEARKANRRSR